MPKNRQKRKRDRNSTFNLRVVVVEIFYLHHKVNLDTPTKTIHIVVQDPSVQEVNAVEGSVNRDIYHREK